MFVIRKPLQSLRNPSGDVHLGSFSTAFSSAFDIEVLTGQQFSTAFSQDFAVFANTNNQFSNAFSSAFSKHNR